MEQLLDTVRALPDVLELAPTAGSEFPAIAWGDRFFHVAPDGAVPRTEQPFATIVTKDYPNDAASRLDPPDRWRLNLHIGKPRFIELFGEEPGAPTGADVDLAADTVLPHPVYRAQGWVAIVCPGRTSTLRSTYGDAVRALTGPDGSGHASSPAEEPDPVARTPDL